MAVAVMAERRPAHHERGGTRLRALQAGETEQRVEQVAHDDGEDRLGDGQAEGHDQRAVEQVLHVEHRARPQPEQSGWPHLAVRVGNQVDPALFDLERGVLLGHLRLRLAAARAAGERVATHLSLQSPGPRRLGHDFARLG
jgi:hypothetical protein